MDLTLGQSLAGLPAFAAYFAAALALLAASLVVYAWVTPYHEIELIREGNAAAAVSFGGAMLGLALPLASVVAHAVSLPDMLAWAVVALVAQLAVYFVVARLVPRFEESIRAGRVAGAALLAAMAVAVGLLNAAALTY
jgi:putative membrane protein